MEIKIPVRVIRFGVSRETLPWRFSNVVIIILIMVGIYRLGYDKTVLEFVHLAFASKSDS